MDKQQFDQLMDRLNTISKLLALNVTQNKSLKEQVLMLYSAGLQLSEIANIVGKKPTDIGQYIYRKKKPSQKAKE